MRKVPGYTLKRLLGRGGMGEVWLATKEGETRQVALKVLRGDRADEQARARFLREAEVMARLDHPNLIKFYESGGVGDDLYITLELVEGNSLDRILHGAQVRAKQSGDPRLAAIRPDLAYAIAMGVGGALNAMHEQQVLHRDVKPGNIMIDGNDRVILMDMGLAHVSDLTGLTKTGHILGTPLYLAPEMMMGDPWDPSVDYYAWGMTWWEMIQGERPFVMEDLFQMLTDKRDKPLPRPVSPHGEIPDEHWLAIKRTMGPRDQRPQTWEEIQRILSGEDDLDGPDTVDMPLGELTSETSEDTSAIPGPLSGSGSRGAQPRQAAAAPRRPSVAASQVGDRSAAIPAQREGTLPPWLLRTIAVVGALIVLLAVRKLGKLLGGAPAPVVVEAPSAALQEVPGWGVRDRRSFFWGVAVAPGVRWHATAAVGDRAFPAPIYQLSDRFVVVWLTGLEPDEDAEVVLEAEALDPLVAPVPAWTPELGRDRPEDFPELLAPYVQRDTSLALTDFLWKAQELIDGVPFVNELQMRRKLAQLEAPTLFDEVPDAAWPTLIRWIRGGGPPLANLARVLQDAKTPIPAAISWQLLHLYGVTPSPFFSEVLNAEMIVPVSRGYLLPVQSFDLMEAWAARDPGARRALFRLLQDMVQGYLTPAGRTGFPRVLPSWSLRVGAAPVSVPVAGEDSLMGLVGLAAQAKDVPRARERLVQLAAGGGPLSGWATALAGVVGDRSLVPGWLERYRKAPVDDLWAVDMALAAQRLQPGFFTAVDPPMLFRVSFPEMDVVKVEAPPGTEWAWREETRAFYFWTEQDNQEIVIEDQDGQRRVFVASVVNGTKEKAP